MTVTRGFTEEADKLLDYLEHGVFDAVEKQYLRSCIFAIYLDNQDPNNIVEAYTFNFSYHNVPGTDVTIPIMSLDADLEKMSISGSSRQTSDPVADATRKGRVPTLGEVKRSLKALVKNLIQATTQMDALPRRRFATFKLFYYEHTPDDYEPMHFHPGDAKKDRWFFTTHAKGEVPERCSVGSIQTGYHGVDVKVTSVSGYLPSTEDNNAPFMGTTHSSTLTAPTLTPMEEAAIRLQQTEAQRKDAMVRRVAWDADDGMCDPDADSEVDPEYGGSDGHNKGISCAVNDSGVEFIEPMGIRDEEGQIRPFSQMDKQQRNICCAHGEAQYAGQQDNVPDRIAQLLRHRNLRTKQIRSPEFSLPPSDVTPPSLPTASSLNMEPSNGAIDTQRVQDLIVNACMNAEDSEMLDMNTQVIPSMNDSITSFTDVERNATEEGTLECECGVVAQDCDCLMCDGGCNRWFHSWCMGFHSAKDERIPATFICFDCRVKADQNWDLIVVHDLYPRMIARFRDLAIFRRAIKVFETSSPDGLAPFTKKMGCDSTVAGQLFKRLEAEGKWGFIATETKEVDALGLMETTTRDTRSKSKGKNAKTKQPRRKILQKPKYVFVKAAKTTQAYEDYFNPDPEVEKRVLRLSELVGLRCTSRFIHS
ncbi:hypothetical protein WOLCODRAFT_96043 [Wolfiporia cocos MD-104 SS10]|uniref:HORMA domain-containing protein n=1 Tax=Wolfiporia cocos (strain MD-104) TaxID=742152 RepID=A0A2H3JDJ8_WOLCO|nr:hypothetical protein WOLCODRAFT_96043 [Wolfiporia cocos MD-104 SS10]